MRTCATPILTDAYMPKCVSQKTREHSDALSPLRSRISAGLRFGAFTLTELIVVLVIFSLFVVFAVTNLSELLRKSTFKAQVHEFVWTMQTAANAAAESDRRYEVIIDIGEQKYVLREITLPDISQMLEEEIIADNDFGANCRVAYVLFDDGDYTNEGRAKFRAGHSGWQYGGKIVLLDEDERAYSVVVSRLSGVVKLRNGDVELLVPKARQDVFF